MGDSYGDIGSGSRHAPRTAVSSLVQHTRTTDHGHHSLLNRAIVAEPVFLCSASHNSVSFSHARAQYDPDCVHHREKHRGHGRSGNANGHWVRERREERLMSALGRTDECFSTAWDQPSPKRYGVADEPVDVAPD